MSPLRVAVLHYHLRGGGVTNVIKHMYSSLPEDDVRFGVLTGEKPPIDFEMPHATIAGLSYGKDTPNIRVEDAKLSILEKAKQLLGGAVDILHVHNYSLGKNAVYSEAILQLAEEGFPIVMHLHDFCEDYRPTNFQLLKQYRRLSGKSLTEELYPIAENVHYALLNARDHDYLKAVGVAENNLHLLPNPVIIPDLEITKSSAQNFDYLLYPVRAIPRKNLAEVLYWSAHPDESLRFGVTLAPKNEQYLAAYQEVLKFSVDQGLPIDFEAGKTWGKSFSEVISGASAIMSTSIAEGFGLAYLESWLSGKSLVGRKLPSIMKDFEQNGISFDGMYEAINIPLELLDEAHLQTEIKSYASKAYEAYALEGAETKVERLYHEIITNNRIDFGKLNLRLQLQLLKQLQNDTALHKELSAKPLIQQISSDTTIEKNQSIIKTAYSAKAFSKRLMHIYQQCMGPRSSSIEYINAEKLIPYFLNAEGFSLLR